MQFLMKLVYTCDYSFETMDVSDQSTPYMFLHNQNYYESVIKGKNGIIAENNRPIEQHVFLNCINDENLSPEISKLSSSFQSNIKSCLQNSEKNLRPNNCPVTRPWLSIFLHTTIFTKCFHAPIAPSSRVQYKISTQNLNNIWNKPFIKQQNSYLMEKLKRLPKTYSKMLEETQPEKLFTTLKKSFKICLEEIFLKEKILNPFDIWKIVFPCVNNKTDSFLKYYIEVDC
jgi:hypothetical protein